MRLLTAVALIAAILSPQPARAAQWWEGWSMDDPRLSQPVHTESVLESFSIQADDGVVLNAAVLRPVVPSGVKVPAIMQLSPYLPADITPPSILRIAGLQSHKYVERGYALVGVSLRGTGKSGGCLDYQGERDRADIDEILDTIAAQPWSDGKIGGIGLSWDGTTLNSAALSGNKHLKTIVPAAANSDWYLWSYLDGIPAYYQGYTFNMYAPPLLMAAFNGTAASPFEQRVCPGTAHSMFSQAHSAAVGVRDEWWDERDLSRFVEGVNPELSVLQVHGYRDDGVRPDNLNVWDRALRSRLPNYRLLMFDGGHLWPDTEFSSPTNPDLVFNSHPMKSWPVVLLRWFDYWLKGRETGIMAMPGALLQDQRGGWHEEDAMQPSEAETIRLYPRSDGSVSDSPADGTVSFVDTGDNVDPRGSCHYVGVGLPIGCVPVRHPNARFFTTDALASDTRFSGIGEMTLRLKVSTPRGHVGVTLYDVDGDKWIPLTYGFSSLNLRASKYEYEHLTPGEVYEHKVRLLARDIVLPAGHRLGLAIGSQIGRYPRGIGGNGYAPVPTGGVTDVLLGSSTVLELPSMPAARDTLPVP